MRTVVLVPLTSISLAVRNLLITAPLSEQLLGFSVTRLFW
jgi:hypothetical protein